MIENFKTFDIEESNFSLNESRVKPEVNLKIEDELCNLLVKLDLDLLIECPPSELNILVEDCHNINEEIQTLLVQKTINSVKGARIITLSQRADFILSQFLKNLFDQRLNLPIRIGNSIDSVELQESFATILSNLYNVFNMDSRYINDFYMNIINNYIFGSQNHPIDFIQFLKTDYLSGKKF